MPVPLSRAVAKTVVTRPAKMGTGTFCKSKTSQSPFSLPSRMTDDARRAALQDKIKAALDRAGACDAPDAVRRYATLPEVPG